MCFELFRIKLEDNNKKDELTWIQLFKKILIFFFYFF